MSSCSKRGFKMWTFVTKWPHRNGFGVGEPRFHPATAAIWNMVAALEGFCCTGTEITITIESTF